MQAPYRPRARLSTDRANLDSLALYTLLRALCRPGMSGLLYIPWFKLPTWHIPIPVLDWELPIQPFGMLVAIGVLLAANVAERFGEKNGVDRRVVADMVAHVVITAFIACYVLNGAIYEREAFLEILRDPRKLFTTYLGLSSYGGFIGAVLGVVIWKIRRKAPAITIADAAAFSFPVGWFFGRLGCFSVHDHPGRVTDFFLAVADYQVGAPPYEPRHDLGLYEVFWCMVIVPVFFWLARKPRVPGFYIAALPIAYAPYRFFLDFLRADETEGGDIRYGGLTPGHYGSVLLLLAGLALAWWLWKNPPARVPEWASVGAAPPVDEKAGREIVSTAAKQKKRKR